jgi:hypothetical protein
MGGSVICAVGLMVILVQFLHPAVRSGPQWPGNRGSSRGTATTAPGTPSGRRACSAAGWARRPRRRTAPGIWSTQLEVHRCGHRLPLLLRCRPSVESQGWVPRTVRWAYAHQRYCLRAPSLLLQPCWLRWSRRAGSSWLGCPGCSQRRNQPKWFLRGMSFACKNRRTGVNVRLGTSSMLDYIQKERQTRSWCGPSSWQVHAVEPLKKPFPGLLHGVRKTAMVWYPAA